MNKCSFKIALSMKKKDNDRSAFFCQLCPLEVAEHRDHGVDGEEQRGGIESFPEAETARDEIDQEPYPPLLRMFLCQHPHIPSL